MRISVAVALALLAMVVPARAQAPSCPEVRRVRAYLHARALDERALEVAEREICGGEAAPEARREPERRWDRPRVQEPLSEEQFVRLTLHPIEGVTRAQEPNACRELARLAWFSVDQVKRVIEAVGRESETACALAFFPRVVDPVNWEIIYSALGAQSEREVRAALGR